MGSLQRMRRAALVLTLLAHCYSGQSLCRSFAAQRSLDQLRQKSGNQIHTPAITNPLNRMVVPQEEMRIITAISEAGSAGDWPRAKAAYIRSKGLFTNVFNAAMVAAFKCRYYNDGVAIYKRLCNAGLPKTEVTYTYALKIFSKLGQLDQVRDIIQEAKEQLKPGIPLFGAMIDAAAEAGKVTEAIEILDTMRSENLVPDTAAWGSAINACKTARNSTVARHLVNFMIKVGVEPNYIVFCNAVGAHNGAGLVHLQKLKSDMAGMGIKGDFLFVETYVFSLIGTQFSARSVTEAVDELSELDPERLTEMASIISEARASQIRLTGLVKNVEGALQRLGFG
ncbi:unnamed protein product [Polarella glacialis]|uniref:Pentacotripeptide-repeat region of PRORP domain-containing protein n=1 Tax=Polarella glacialis TaxID=89957 RepID=A0A813KH77_POLGL|nr:unnamed protein product [Polarella glacialis]CAE8703003.1 unnamed protein product [Polarella glacialis]